MTRCSNRLRLAVLMSLAFLACGCTRTDQEAVNQQVEGRRPVRILLNWFPEAEHGGYYAALVHDEFAAAQLDVEIVPGGPNVPVIQKLDAGDVEFGISNADQILQARAAGADIVSLFAPLQVSPRCIMVHEESGIRSIADLKDVTLAVDSTSTFYYFLAHKRPLQNVTIVAYSGSVAPFLANPRYAQQAYVISEPYLARQQGAHPVSLMVSDAGFNPYTSTLVTRRELLEREPELVRQVVQACRRGWRKYLADPQATNERIGRENPEIPLDALAYGASELTRLCLPDGLSPESLGTMTAERWEQLASQMVEAELLQPLDARAAFTTRFLEAGDEQPSP